MAEDAKKHNRKKWIGLSAIVLLSIGACGLYTLNQPQPVEEVKESQTITKTEEPAKQAQTTTTRVVDNTAEESNTLDRVVEIASLEVGEEAVDATVYSAVIAVSEQPSTSDPLLDNVVVIATPDKPEIPVAVLPETPQEPVTPEIPVTPELPVEPTTPVRPVEPTEPTTPVEPTQPEQPVTPELTDDEKALTIQTRTTADGKEEKFAVGEVVTEEALPEFDVALLPSEKAEQNNTEVRPTEGVSETPSETTSVASEKPTV